MSVTSLLAAANRLDCVLLVGRGDDELRSFARLIHDAGPHAAGPFVPIDASAIPSTLLECEVWSFEGGALAGVTRRRRGRLEGAHGGTLFLANVEELELAAQQRLLRTLDERVAAPIRGETPYRVSARLIVSTGKDLTAAVRDGRFREDLYNRLSATVITMPPPIARH